MNPQDIQLKEDVMRRVRAVYWMRRVFNFETLKGAVFALSCLSVIYLVSVPNVIANMSRLSDLWEDVRYLTSAFMHTSVAVEAALLAGLATGLWLAVDIVKNLTFDRLRLKEA